MNGLAEFTTLITGVFLGFSVSAPPGPINATAAYEVGARSWLAGWMVELGATTGDGIFFLLTYVGITDFLAKGTVSQVLFLVGGFVLLYLAFTTVRHRRVAGAARRGIGKSPYFLGLTIALMNPFQIAWWITVGVGMVSNFGLSILLGLFTGILAWTLIYTCILSVGLSRYQKAYPFVVYASASVLGIFGVWFVITAALNLFA